MVDIESWMKIFTKKMEETFSYRVWFIGLQGSYGRGEAKEASDIDVVVILDNLQANDLMTYKNLLDTLPNRELICGFISGKNEILNWEPSDLFQFYYDTTPIKGTLNELLDKIDKQVVKRAIKIGACNIYHACVHNFVHEQNEEILISLYKSAVFVIKAFYFYETDKYIKSKIELQKVYGAQSTVLNTVQNLKSSANLNFKEMSIQLIDWASAVIGNYN